MRGVVLEDDADSAPETLLSSHPAPSAETADGRPATAEGEAGLELRPKASCEKDLASFIELCTREALPLGD